MGRARSHGYRFDNPNPAPGIANGTPVPTGHRQPVGNASSVHRPTARAAVTPPHRPAAASGRGRGSGRAHGDRMHRNRRSKDQGCRNPQVRKGIGSCVFVLGIPCLIAGLILTIVSSTDGGGGARKYPASFPVLGPILLALSVICFVVGALLYNESILKGLRNCLRLSDKDSFVRRHFPRLSAWLKPDMVTALNQAAINNLQTAPTRSALRKIPNPDLVIAVKTGLEDEEGQGEDESRPNHRLGPNNGNHHHHAHHHHPLPRRKRGVTFSEGDDSELEGGFVGVRLNSVSSEPDRLSVQSDNGGTNGQALTSSLLSLRHCKIRPKDDVFWTETSAATTAAGDLEANGGGGGGESGGHPADMDGVEMSECGGAMGGSVGFPLANIDEERA